MRLLLDTHVAIWLLAEPDRVASEVFEAVRKPGTDVWISSIAIWEIAIKHSLKRADSPPFSGHEAIGHFRSADFSLLDVTPAHAAFVERLPPLHGDPFDRLMIAQAIVEGMQFVTYDRHLARYDLGILTWR